MPAIVQLTRIEPVHLARLEAQGIFTTGLLLERSETPTRRQTLADQTDASLADVGEWRDEALAGMQAGLQSREPDHRDGFIHDLKAKVGDQAMQIELLEKKIEILEDGLRPPPRRPSL